LERKIKGGKSTAEKISETFRRRAAIRGPDTLRSPLLRTVSLEGAEGESEVGEGGVSFYPMAVSGRGAWDTCKNCEKGKKRGGEEKGVGGKTSKGRREKKGVPVSEFQAMRSVENRQEPFIRRSRNPC